MTVQKLIPYQEYKEQNFTVDYRISLTQNDFQGAKFKEGKMTFSFQNCVFSKVEIENLELINFNEINLHFFNCIIENISAEVIESENICLIFNNCIISNLIINSPLLKSVSFNNCILERGLLKNQNNIDISYTEENIFPKKWQKLLNKKKIKFSDLIAKSQFYSVFDPKKIYFRTSEEKNNKIRFYRNKIFKSTENYLRIFLTEKEKRSFNLNLFINYSQVIDNAECRVNNSYLNSFSLSGNSYSAIFIENTRIHQLFIRDFSAQKETNFYNIAPLKKQGSLVEIHKSNLDNTWFDNIEFSSYDTVSFYRAKFVKTRFSSCNFTIKNTDFENFKTLANVHYPDEKPENYYKDQYETFLQLKLSLETSGNFYESQKLQAFAFQSLRKIKNVSIGDKVILCLNRKSNNHGLSIGLPFLWFLGFTISFYIFYLCSLKKIYFDGDIDYKLVGHYFSFIDLTHRPDFLIDKEKLSAWSLFWDFSNKIISGYLIYQFVSAFRKYGRKVN